MRCPELKTFQQAVNFTRSQNGTFYSLINSDRVLTLRFVKDAGWSLCVPLCFMSWFTASSSLRRQRPRYKHKKSSVVHVFKQTSVMHLIQTALEWSSRFWESKKQRSTRLPRRRESVSLCVVYELTYCGFVPCQKQSWLFILALFEITHRCISEHAY